MLIKLQRILLSLHILLLGMFLIFQRRTIIELTIKLKLSEFNYNLKTIPHHHPDEALLQRNLVQIKNEY